MEPEFFTAERPGRGPLPFSDAVRAGNTYYIAGQIGLDDETGKPPSEAGDEARALMESLRRALGVAGLEMSDIVQITIHTPDVSLYSLFNEVYLSYFTGKLPARAFLGSGPLLFDARFELTAVAYKAASASSS